MSKHMRCSCLVRGHRIQSRISRVWLYIKKDQQRIYVVLLVVDSCDKDAATAAAAAPEQQNIVAVYQLPLNKRGRITA